MEPKHERSSDKVHNSFWSREHSLKTWTFGLLLIVVLIGFIFPLFAEVIIGTWFPARVRGVEVWNQFTSVILGVVATVLALVSMFMGFKSYDDSSELQKTCLQTLEHIKLLERDVHEIPLRFRFDQETPYPPSKKNWAEENMNTVE